MSELMQGIQECYQLHGGLDSPGIGCEERDMVIWRSADHSKVSKYGAKLTYFVSYADNLKILTRQPISLSSNFEHTISG